MDRIAALHKLGQSIWYDNIERRLLINGQLADMISRGEIRGITSNPSIFHNAIAKTNDYDSAMQPMAWSGWKTEDIFWQLAVEDVRSAADLFKPLYEETSGGDGYVSLEVSPKLAHDSRKTFRDVQHLWSWVDRPNLMIKIPATPEGLPAIRKAIAAGINVNVTLIFSLERYAEVMDAYLSGLEDRLKAGKPLAGIASVASFFVSRVDTKVDAKLKANGSLPALALMGKAAIANTRLAYALYKKTFSSERFERLQKAGAQVQRPLWASTSTKNPDYRDVLYIEELIGPQTVNTVPPTTLDAFRDHGQANLTLEQHLDDAQQQLDAIEALGISMSSVTQELEDEGVKSFSDAFTAMLQTINVRRKQMVSALGSLQPFVASRVSTLESNHTVKRIFELDSSLWTSDAAGQAEIRRRLGWLNAPVSAKTYIAEAEALAREVVDEGYTQVILLGMGGSSLAPEVYRLVFGIGKVREHRALDLAILDSTDPAQVRAVARLAPMEETLFIVSSKSGSTSEVNAFLSFFWAKAQKKFGKKAGRHFIAITDPGTALERTADERGFRQTFISDPSVGGRYSALTPFGIVPAALLGIDLPNLIESAEQMLRECQPEIPAGRNPGLVLGAVMAEAALHGKDKMTILTDAGLSSFGSWMEQLIAESSGKQGKGIIPIDIEPITPIRTLSRDRWFVYLRSTGEQDKRVIQLQRAGHPVVVLAVPSPIQLGAEFYRCEFATAVACAIIGVNGFDQPDVQDNKTRTEQNIRTFQETGKLEEGSPIWSSGSVSVYGSHFSGVEKSSDLTAVVSAFLASIRPGDYIALNAYLPRNPMMLKRLQRIRRKLLQKTGCATTLGFGPRFLHSTGQLHKGGPDSGVFIQITADPTSDLQIPGQGLSFGTLERAQALGDLEALLARGRRVIRIHLKLADLDKIA
jgi:transaldolase/glucose-6-phosphate isomerase